MNQSEWLKNIISTSGLSKDEIADKLGIGKPALFKILREGKIQENHVEQLEQILKLPRYIIRYGYMIPATLINYSLLKTIVTGVEDYLSERKTTLPPDTRAAVYTQLYEHYADTPSEATSSAIKKILKISKDLNTN